MDSKLWSRLSPLLDELLDLPPPEREPRLAQVRAEDPALADHLAAMLAHDAELERQGFLDAPAAQAVVSALAEDDAPPDLSGQRIGPYELRRELGQGGMGSVWLAQRVDGRFEGHVAVKFLKSGLFSSGNSGRFAREGQILGRLSHPHIARLLDAGLHDGGQPYLVLEYVEGLPIDKFCQHEGLDVPARIRLFLDVLAAVAHAHSRLILHRDLKPSNILVTPDGQVKLLDFGIAKLLDDATQAQEGAAATELTQRAGSAFTPQFAAPEQVQQGDVTTATDVYALGVLLYLLLGGRHPTEGATTTQLDRLKAVVETEPRRLSSTASECEDPAIARQAKLLRGDLDTIVAKALKKKPSERYANAQALADELQRWLAHEPISARPDSRLYVVGRFVRRHRVAVSLASLAVLALTGLTGVSVWQAHRAEVAQAQADQRRNQAENLLSYLLGELADQLRPVGRLALLEGVAQQAMQVLGDASLAAGSQSADEDFKRVRALTMLAEVQLQKERFPKAEEALSAARRWLEHARSSTVDQDALLRQEIQLEFWSGELALRQSAMLPAREHWLRTLELSERWVALKPGLPEALLELANASANVGILELRSLRLNAAAQRFQVALGASRTLYQGKVDSNEYSKKLSDDLVWGVEAAIARGDFRTAQSFASELLTLVEQRRAIRPQDLLPKVDRAIALGWRMQALDALGEPAAAERDGREALALWREARAGDPGNQRWQRLGLSYEALWLHREMQMHPQEHQLQSQFADGLRIGLERLRAQGSQPPAMAKAVLALWQTRGSAPQEALMQLEAEQALPASWSPQDSRPRYSELRMRAMLDLERLRLMRLMPTQSNTSSCAQLRAYWAPVASAGVAGPVPELWRQLENCP